MWKFVNANRTGGTITANGASMSFTSGVQGGTNRQSTAAGITVTTNAAGDITSLLGKTLAYDSAGRLSEATAVPPCPSGSNCAGEQTTLSRFNGWGQRFLRDTPNAQTVFSYGTEGFNLLSETTRNLSTSALSTTEHIWLPTASGPMPVATVINGTHYAVHADHLNTPRRLSDSAGQTRWQWPYSGFGEINPQSTPAAGQAAVSYSLRYPGQIDDGNGLFYNWHRFYDPRVGRYTKADPIGLEGGWNRFGYVDGNPLMYTDPEGLLAQGLVDFSAGLGDVLLFGQGQRLRELFDVNGGVDQCSDAYGYGEWAGIAGGLATGLAGGLKAAGTKGAGKEFSHWIPNRMGGPRSTWNGNYVPTATHALSDPYRYRFMPRSWKAQNPMPNPAWQQWTRIPNAYKGGATGGAYGAAGAAQGGCSCRR